MTIESPAQVAPPGALGMSANAPKLLTVWAEGERKRLLGALKAKEVKLRIEPGRLHPETMPMHRNLLALNFAFDPKRKHSTGRVRALFVLYSHGRTSGKAWIGMATLMREAGFVERNNARKAVDDLHNANIVPKTERPPTEQSPRYLTNVYDIPHRDETDLLDLVFAAATGITALYVLVLRKLWVSDDGFGSAYLTRKGVRDALAEGVLDKNDKLVIDRTLCNTKIVEHFRTLLSDELILKIGNGRVTIPAARGHQAIKEGAGRIWDRKDQGTKKPRRVVQTKSFPAFSPPPFTNIVSPPPPGVSAALPTPPPGSFPALSPHESPALELMERSIEAPNDSLVLGNDTIHLSPHVASGSPSALADFEGEGAGNRPFSSPSISPNARLDEFVAALIETVGAALPTKPGKHLGAINNCAAAIRRGLVEAGRDEVWALAEVRRHADRLTGNGRCFDGWGSKKYAAYLSVRGVVEDAIAREARAAVASASKPNPLTPHTNPEAPNVCNSL